MERERAANCSGIILAQCQICAISSGQINHLEASNSAVHIQFEFALWVYCIDVEIPDVLA